MMKSITRYALVLVAFFCLTRTVQAAKEDVLKKFLDNYRAPFDSEVQLGVWHGDLDKCKELADKHGIPMIAIWSQKGCAHCEILEKALMSDAFNNWAKQSGVILSFTCTEDPKGQNRYNRPDGDNTTIGKSDGAYYWFCKRPNLLKSYPFVRFYWYEDGKKKVDYSVHGDKVDGQQGIANGTYDKAGNNCINYILNTSGLKPYLDSPKTLASYVGGTFTLEESEGNRLEAEDGTATVSFELAREGAAAAVATNNLVILVGPDGQEAETVNVEWAAGQSNQTVTVDISGVSFTENGQQASIILQDANGTPQGTNHVTYVSGNSSGNPLWIGERSSGAVSPAPPSGESPLSIAPAPVLDWGEWTMDLDVAKEKVLAAECEAYTLVAIVGSLWCHDCANTARNFTDVTDSKGNNRFAAWAKSNNVALVSLDIPNFTTNSVECASPTLLSRKAYETRLAYELPDYGMYDVSKGGAPESLATPALRSGLGYLTRKGVSDEDAAPILERNWRLVSTNTDKGGFHRPEDTNKNRTGVPIFVLLRKDGTVAARMTRFAAVSPMKDLNWDNIIKRFDEMLEIAKDTGDHADPTEIENNDASTTTLSFRANGGSAYGEISHTDFQDVFKLEGVGGNALQKVTVDGASDAVVSVQFMKLNAEGKSEAVGTAATGKLSDGVALEETFAEAGDFFVKVSGGDIASGDFTVDSAKAGNFAAFTISGDVVLVPQEAKASGSAPADSDRVVMRLEKDQMYRIEGVVPTNEVVAAVLAAKSPDDPYCKFYTALVSGDEEVVSAYGNGGTVTYQKWVPCKVGFVAAAKTVTESVGKVSVAVARTDGSSGDVTVRVSLDEEATTLYNDEHEPRFTPFEPMELTWADGKVSTTNVTIEILDDKRFDGTGDVALKLELVSDENGDTVLTTTNYVLTVTEDDKQSAGQAAFTGAEPFFSKKATVYAKESEGATVYAERVEGSDGYVTVQVKATGGALEIDGEVTNLLVWANHKNDRKPIKVTGLPAGKLATLTLEKPTDGLKVLTASNKVTVVSVADDAPEFATDAAAITVRRYVASSNVYPVVLAEGVTDAKLSFALLLGKLPAGLKATAATDALVIAGAPTAKPGVYPVVYQVTQQVGTQKTPGLTIALTITVEDPTDATSGAPYNEAVAEGANGKGSARTIKGIPVINRENDRLVGLLQVTIPKTGKISAKYFSSAGNVSFTSKDWSSYNEGTRALSARLTAKKAGYAMELGAEADGVITATLTDPTVGETADLVAASSGKIWSRNDNASDWAGRYTVALLHEKATEAAGHEGVAPRGNGYLTLRMEGTAVNSGTVKWKGMLPNGTAVSGSTILNVDSSCDGNAKLPIYQASSADILALVIDLCDTTLEASDVKAYWKHTDKKYEATSYDIDLNVFGGLYSASTNLASICTHDYGSTELKLSFDMNGLLGSTASGKPQQVDDVPVSVGEKNLTVAKGNAAKATLAWKDKNAGVVKGEFSFLVTDEASSSKTLKAKFEGIVLLGWGTGCGCGEGGSETPLPFVVGGYYIDDKELVESGDKTVSVSVKRGGAVSVDK